MTKRISQLDTDLDKAQEQLSEANNKLEEAAKKSADVSVLTFFQCFALRGYFSIETDQFNLKKCTQQTLFLIENYVYIVYEFRKDIFIDHHHD